ncbi:hypothetical protein CGZ69_34765 [Streptomyces peucetius subsp. caesius ATCC 27952]|nr:hypothetical protein CGZ69_34765 [Streptomyces peucetius subsp. caesius ATCC 27952]
MLRMIDQVAARPHLLRMTARDSSPPHRRRRRLRHGSCSPRRGRTAVADGALGHALLTAEKSGDA